MKIFTRWSLIGEDTCRGWHQESKTSVQQKDGRYKIIEAKEENGFYVYETDFLGNVSVIGDQEIKEDSKQLDLKLPSNNSNSVQGNYTGGVGGAKTGDDTKAMLYSMIIFLSYVRFVCIRIL